MPLPRFRLRTLMIAVAVAGVLFGIGTGLRRRHASFKRRAAECAAKSYNEMLKGMRVATSWFQSDQTTKIRDEHYLLMDYYDELKVKYERAARRPWLPVPPDPPPPE